MDSELQRRYFQLRTQLSGLNYSCNFGLDALDVVQELFTDLISTTESYTLLQEKESKMSHDLTIAQTHLLPLRKEIGRLTKENHHFHLDNIRIKEESVEEISKLVAESQKAQLEATELRHVVYLKDIELQKAEFERMRIREAYEGLAAASLSGAATKIKRSIKSTGNLPKTSSENNQNQKNASHSSSDGAGEASAVADRALMARMRQQIDTLSEHLATAEEKNKSLEGAVRRREQELGKELQKATSRSLEGGPGDSEGKLEMMMMADGANARIIDQLNGQVDFLNDQLAIKESQLADLGEKLLECQELRTECENRGKLLDASREENAVLVTELRELEERIEELNHYTDPEGGMSIQSLSQGSSLGADKAPASLDRNLSPLSTPSPISKLRVPSSGGIMEKLKDERTGLLGEVNNLNGRVSELATEENMLRTRLMRAEDRIESLKSELERSSSELEGMAGLLTTRTQEATELRLQLEDARSSMDMAQEKLNEKSERLAAYEGQSRGSASSAARLEKEKSYLEETLTSVTAELSAARKEKFQTTLQYEELVNGELRTLRSDCESLSKNVEDMTSELTELRSHSMSLEAENAHYMDELDNERSRLRRAQRQCEDLDKRYSETSSELTRAMSTIFQLQGMVRYLQSENENDAESLAMELLQPYSAHASTAAPAVSQGGQKSPGSPGNISVLSATGSISASVRGKASELNALRKQLQEERVHSEQLSEQLSNIQHEVMATRQQHVVSSSRLQALEAEYKSTVQQLETRDIEVTRRTGELDSLRHEHRRLQSELKSRDAAFEALSMSESERLEKIEYLSAELDRLSSENRLLNHRAEEAGRSVRDTETRAAEAGAMASTAVARVTAAERAAEKAQGTVRDLQRELSGSQGKMFDLEQRLNDAQKAFEKARSEREAVSNERNALMSKVSELKSVIASLDSTSRDGALRVTRVTAMVEESKQALRRVEEENEVLRRHIQERDEKIDALSASMSALDEDRDSLQNQLDSLAEEADMSESVRAKTAREVGDVAARLQECEQRLSATIQEVTISRRHCAVAENRIASLKSELDEAHKRFNLAHSEVAGAAEDLQLMTKENQAITSELAEVTFERDRLVERVGELSVVAANLEQARRGVEIERSDLLTAYRTALQHKRRLETDLSSMGMTKQRMATSLQQMHSDAAEMRAQLADRANHLDREAYDRSALMNQIETLNSQLVSAAQSSEGVEADNRRLIQENYTLTQANQMLHERITMLLKRATSASDSSKVLAARLAGVERERDAMRAVAGIEKQKASDLSSVVELARSQAATAHAQVDRYRHALVSTSNAASIAERSADSKFQSTQEKQNSEASSKKITTTTTSTIVTSSRQQYNSEYASSHIITAASPLSPESVNEAEDSSKSALLESVLGISDGNIDESSDEEEDGIESESEIEQ